MNLKGINILITAGPTREMWDTVRYLTNLSSGKTGMAIAEKAREWGASVTLVSQVKPADTRGMKYIKIESALDMFRAVKKEFLLCDVFISSAAVCDFRPVRSKRKISKTSRVECIRLARNPDILRWAGSRKGRRVIAGFALADRMDVEKGLRKMKDKKCDIMIINAVSNLGASKKSFKMVGPESSMSEYRNAALGRMAGVILGKCLQLTGKR
ncbi:MAG: phosphopantothenoylcysteine decarboxylase [Elusimicrobia bacterium]|nr:phosphopantothenoylcysteine decarboxylase [Elusimicrobiota bacterium]